MRQGSFQLFHFAGVPVCLNATFLITLIFCFTAFRSMRDPGQALALGFVYALALFAAILLHEAGHALMARRFGIPTRAIEIHGLGGTAYLARSGRTRLQSILISLAGPAVNLALYVAAEGALALLDAYDDSLIASGAGEIQPGPFIALSTIAWLNKFLLLFNLLPGFPLDGGNVAVQILSRFVRNGLAVKIVAVCGMVLGIAMLGLVQAWGASVLFLAFFLVLENWQIYQNAR